MGGKSEDKRRYVRKVSHRKWRVVFSAEAIKRVRKSPQGEVKEMQDGAG